MISQMAKKIELRFWDVIIPLLSKAAWLNKVIGKTVEFFHDEALVKQTAIVIVIACAGFASGFLIFSLSTLFS